jgi:hypothetical protein
VHAVDYFMQMWMKEECQINDLVATVNNTVSQVLPANPMRFAVLLPGTPNATNSYVFSEVPVASGPLPIKIASNSQILVVTFDQVGSYVRLPIWAWNSAGSYPLEFIEMSYRPEKYGIYRRYMDEFVPKLLSP